ncbi:SLC2A4 regulator isoform X5 [Acinonyx jubatus]|uniref:SLC2A4 regulator isoform X5 n=1 Tax=Acinonyx jubatus TaxID=32536 RepID=A0ABM3N8A9_ACIJB|nr:SLC2A4 regulator isoform X5 [Acinonyx jubatus]
MGARLAPAAGRLGMLIQRESQWACAGGGAAGRGARAARRGRGRPAASRPRGAGGGRLRAGVGGPASPARPGPGPCPERPPSPLQPRHPAGRPWRPSALRCPFRVAGAPRPVPPAGTPRPRPCRCPRRRRDPPGKSRLDEVMAAAALTSLSTSTLLLGAPAAACSPEPGLEPWKEALVRPLGSCSSSGDWGWDLASDRSSPSIPSPPLPSEAAHFLFGEPAPKKRKSSVRVLFQCLWKRCGKVLSTASGMQRHIRLVHLGRQAEPEQSDGEEDFYYTELDVGMDVLTDGLSSLSPASPSASVPPASPRLELPEPRTLSSLLHPLALPPVPVLSPVAPREARRGDDACQGCLAPTRPEPQPTTVRTCVPTPPSRLGASPRKPRGDAKKCRKVYGMDHRHLWCTACRWKKACQRFLD